jgi:hypothetical protein
MMKKLESLSLTVSVTVTVTARAPSSQKFTVQVELAAT